MNRKTDLDSIIKDYKECTLDEVFVEHVLDDLNDLKNFYKPVVPQFVADWYEDGIYFTERILENRLTKEIKNKEF